MAETHPILCSKCKKPGSADRAECASCGGRVVRVCGSCGFKNSAAKRFCDACGENFAAAKAEAAPKASEAALPRENARSPQPPPKAEPPKPAPKPPEPKPQIRLDEPKPEPKPVSKEPLELKPAERPPEAAPKDPEAALPRDSARSSKDEALERFIPKTVISRLPKADAPKVERDDEPVPDMRPVERPKDEPSTRKEDTPPPPPPEKKKERVKMRLEGQAPTPLPKKAEEAAPKASEAALPRENARSPVKGEPKAIDPRLVKGYEEKRKAPPPESAPPRRHESVSQTFIQRRPKAVFSTVLALFFLGSGLAVYFLKLKEKSSPEQTLLKAAGDYLFALKQKDWSAAYAMLSSASRRAATVDAFRSLQEDADWTFDELRAEIVAPGWALVRYKLYGKSSEEDWLVLQLEEGRWRRAYWWPLMAGLEDALSRADHAAAARLAREAQAIDPLDPMPYAYHCEAAHLANDAKAAQESCAKALKMAQTLPSRLGPEGIFRLNHILADIERRVLKRPAEAVRSYGLLLAFPRLSEEERCDILLARAEAQLELGQHAPAIEDFRAARSSCRLEADAAAAARSAAVLGGEAGAEAVALVQAYRAPGAEETLLDWRQKARVELAKRLRTRPSDMPPDRWEPAHKGGSLYSVTLRSGSGDVLSAEADLFTRKVKVDTNVQ